MTTPQPTNKGSMTTTQKQQQDNFYDEPQEWVNPRQESMGKDDFIKLIQAEIKWCEKHPDKAFTKEYRKGFINGLIQATYLISQLQNAQTEDRKVAKQEIIRHIKLAHGVEK